MAKPWEKYAQQSPADSGPWAQYGEAKEERPDFAANPPGVPRPNVDMKMSGLGKAHRIATNPGVIVPAIVNGMRQTEQENVVTPEDSGITAAAKHGANASIGAMKGALHTGTGLSPLINKIPLVGETLAPSAGIREANEIAKPVDTSQQIGYTGEQLAEWMLPTGAEGKVAGLTGKALANSPKIARMAVPAAKIATSAVESGVRNKIQGGDFTTGAAVGGAGTAVAPVLKKAASGIADVAMAPGKRLLKSIPEDVNIGDTVLRETSGVRPETITRQLKDKIATRSADLDNLVEQADRSGKKVSLLPARKVARSELKTAITKNSPAYIKDVGKVEDRLVNQYGPTGEVSGNLPDIVAPSKARALKQGLDLDIATWNPEAQNNIGPLKERIYGSINEGFHKAVPGAAAIDKNLSSLIPAKDAAWNVSFNPSITRNVFNRIARPTGALVGAGIGGTEGYKEGGIPGAVAGGAVGLVAPELIASPTGQMIIARSLENPGAAGRLLKGGMLQLDRPSHLVDENQPTD